MKSYLKNLMNTTYNSVFHKTISPFVRFFSLIVLFLLLLSSCNIIKKTNIYYFKDLKGDTTIQSTVNEKFELLVKKKDVIIVNISALNLPEVELFNSTQTFNTGQGQIPGYLVDSNGNISLHKIGDVHVEGLSLKQVSKKIENELTPYLKDPIAVVSFANKKVLVFGEVTAPQIIQITNDKAPTVLEALTICGGINEKGDNKNVLIVREENGKKQFKYLNFEDVAVLNSPWYNLRPEDIVYVQPDIKRSTDEDKFTKRQMTITTILAGTSLFFLIFDKIFNR